MRDPRVQGRAAEALGMLGDRADADAVSGMVRTHVAGGALAGSGADDLSYPLAPAAEAARLGLYALVRLRSFEALCGRGARRERTAGLDLVARGVCDPAARRSARRRRARRAAEHAGPLHRGVCRPRARRHEGASRPRHRSARSSSAARRIRRCVIQAVRALAAIGDAAARRPADQDRGRCGSRSRRSASRR